MKYTNNFNLPLSVYNAIVGRPYDITKRNPYRISLTTLINAPRPHFLQIRHWHKLEEDASDNVWRLLGNAVHYILQKAEDKNSLAEQKIEEKVGKFTVVSKVDRYDNLEKAVQDYKITSVWNIIYTDTKSWEEQLNPYAWAYRKAGFKVEKLQIIAILRDWQKSKALYDQNYPQIPIVTFDIPLWSMDKQKKYIKDRLKIYEDNMNLSDDDLPICSEKERWYKPPKYAVMKGQNKKATKLYDKKEDAEKYALELSSKGKAKYHVDTRKGEDTKCLHYCKVKQFCKHYKNNYGKEKT